MPENLVIANTVLSICRTDLLALDGDSGGKSSSDNHPPRLAKRFDPSRLNETNTIHLGPRLSTEMFAQWAEEWRTGLRPHLPPGHQAEVKKLVWTPNLETVMSVMFGIFAKMALVNGYQDDERPGQALYELLSYDKTFTFPLSMVVGYTEEINQVLSEVSIGNEVLNSGWWGFRDFIDMMTTTGRQVVGNKAGWYRNLNNTGNFVAKNDAVNTILYWSSLAPDHEACLSLLDQMPGDKLCQQAICKSFCNAESETLSANSAGLLQKVLGRTVQLATMGGGPDIQPGGVVPFCFHGKKLFKMLEILKRGQNFPHKSLMKNSFCTKARLTLTDQGICTTYNLPSYKIYKRSVKDILKNVNSDNKDLSTQQLLYPPQLPSDPYEMGVLLVLDTWAVSGFKTTVRDSSFGLSPKGTPLESESNNNVKILLHGHNQVPMFNDYASTVISLNIDDPLWKQKPSVASFRVKIKAWLASAEGKVKEKDLSVRQCMFPDETHGLSYFDVYTQKNCQFECKLRLAEKRCGCIPWYYATDNSTSVCGLLGNLCFQDWLTHLKKNLHLTGWPPCGCYQDCIAVNYIDIDDQPQKSYNNQEWLDLFALRDVKYLHGNLTGMVEKIQAKNADQFLVRYLLDYFNPTGQIGRRLTKHLQPGHGLSTKKFSPDFPERARHLALLYIDFGYDSYKSYNKIVRVSVPDMLSAIGGTFSLFTGFSLVILVDACMWIRARVCQRKAASLPSQTALAVDALHQQQQIDELCSRVGRISQQLEAVRWNVSSFRKGRF